MYPKPLVRLGYASTSKGMKVPLGEICVGGGEEQTEIGAHNHLYWFIIFSSMSGEYSQRSSLIDVYVSLALLWSAN